MRAKPLLVAFGFLLLASCGSAEHPRGPGFCEHVRFVSSVFTDDERAALERANARWNKYGIEQDCLADAENEAGGIHRLEYGSDAWKAVSAQFGGQNVLGVYHREDDSIVIVSGMDAPTFEIVALHELGHARGLGHVTGGPAIMNAAIGAATDFTPLDRAECERVGACSSGAVKADDVVAAGDDVYVFVKP